MRRAARSAPVPVLFLRTTVLAATMGVAFAALPTAAQKKTFRETKAWTVSIEVTSRAGKAFDPEPSPKTTTDKARFSRKTFAFAITLDQPVTSENLATLMHPTPEEMSQEGRFVGWEAVPSPKTASGRGSLSTSYDPSKDSGMTPVRFAVESIEQSRSRHNAEEPWHMVTISNLGSGVLWLERSALLLCDLTRVACDLRLGTRFGDGADLLTETVEIDGDALSPRVRTQGAAAMLGTVAQGPLASLDRFEIDLPAPVVKEFRWSPRGVDPLEESTIMKVTIAPAKIAADAKRSN